jgi:hypothetical protein
MLRPSLANTYAGAPACAGRGGFFGSLRMLLVPTFSNAKRCHPEIPVLFAGIEGSQPQLMLYISHVSFSPGPNCRSRLPEPRRGRSRSAPFFLQRIQLLLEIRLLLLEVL